MPSETTISEGAAYAESDAADSKDSALQAKADARSAWLELRPYHVSEADWKGRWNSITEGPVAQAALAQRKLEIAEEASHEAGDLESQIWAYRDALTATRERVETLRARREARDQAWEELRAANGEEFEPYDGLSEAEQERHDAEYEEEEQWIGWTRLDGPLDEHGNEVSSASYNEAIEAWGIAVGLFEDAKSAWDRTLEVWEEILQAIEAGEHHESAARAARESFEATFEGERPQDVSPEAWLARLHVFAADGVWNEDFLDEVDSGAWARYAEYWTDLADEFEADIDGFVAQVLGTGAPDG